MRQLDQPIIEVKPAFEALTGYLRNEIVGRDRRCLQGSNTDPDALVEVRAALAEQRSCNVVLKNCREDGTPFWNNPCLSPLISLDGELTHYAGIQDDGTTLEAAYEYVDFANQANAEFFSRMSHEPRMPMNAALGFAQPIEADSALPEVQDPRRGIELAAKHSPDVILLDINLPDMTGYEVLRVIRADPSLRDVPVLAVSASAHQREIERARKAGFIEYLTKPLDVDCLLAIPDKRLSESQHDKAVENRKVAGHV